jgi:response regulator of citrate/malate metabolism
MDKMNRRLLLDETIASVSEHIRQLQNLEKETTEQLEAKRAILNAWMAELADLDNGRKNRKSARLPRGEARRTVLRWFAENESLRQQGVTVKQIAEATGLNWTTVRNVLHHPKSDFVETDGEWTTKAQPRLKAVN